MSWFQDVSGENPDRYYRIFTADPFKKIKVFVGSDIEKIKGTIEKDGKIRKRTKYITKPDYDIYKVDVEIGNYIKLPVVMIEKGETNAITNQRKKNANKIIQNWIKNPSKPIVPKKNAKNQSKIQMLEVNRIPIDILAKYPFVNNRLVQPDKMEKITDKIEKYDDPFVKMLFNENEMLRKRIHELEKQLENSQPLENKRVSATMGDSDDESDESDEEETEEEKEKRESDETFFRDKVFDKNIKVKKEIETTKNEIVNYYKENGLEDLKSSIYIEDLRELIEKIINSPEYIINPKTQTKFRVSPIPTFYKATNNQIKNFLNKNILMSCNVINKPELKEALTTIYEDIL